MNVDPAASMRCWEIAIELGGRVFTIPALPAADWWPVIVSGDPSAVLDLLPRPGQDAVNDLVIDGEVGGSELTTAIIDAIEEASGRSFHAAFVLASVAESNWAAVGGRLALKGFRWDASPIAAALDAIYVTVLDGLEEKPRTEFLRILDDETLTGGTRKVDRQKAAAQFAELAGPMPTTGAKASGARSGSERPRTRRRPRPPRQGDPLTAPTPPPGSPAGNGQPARSGHLSGEAAPASA